MRNYGKDYTLGRIGTIDQGLSFGLGRKLEGLYDAAFGKIGDLAYTGGEIVANIQNKGLKGALDDLEKKPSFWERYHQTVDPIVQAIGAPKTNESYAIYLYKNGTYDKVY